MEESVILNYWPNKEYTPRKVQEKALKWIEQLPSNIKYILIEAAVGCHALDTNILMHDGTIKKVQDIIVGDRLMGPDSTPRNVLCLHRGREQMYNILPVKGDKFTVNENHILSLKETKLGKKNKKSDGNRIKNISVKDYLNKSKDFKNNHKLYRSTGVEFSKKVNLLIDPYFLGILLGDGSFKNSITVTSMDNEIDDYIYKMANEYNLCITKNVKENNKASAYKFRRCDYKRYELNNFGINIRIVSKLRKELDYYNLSDKICHNKFIPHDYKIASREDRLKLLAGLIDTDGHYHQGSFEISTKSNQLHSDILFLARSLGFAAYASYGPKTIDGIVVGNYYRIIISGDTSQIPTLLPRKKASPRRQKKRVTVTGFTVEKTKIDNYYGFEVDGDNLYLGEDFTIHHNSGKSILGINASGYFSKSLGSSFILTPQKMLQQQYVNTFESYQLKSLKGKSNYECHSKNTNCDIGGDIKPACESCPHKNARQEAINSPNMVMNYALALLMFKFADEQVLKKRKLMIFDECHTLENFLTEFDAISISDQRCKKVKIPFFTPKNSLEAIQWIQNDYYKALRKAYNIIADQFEEIKNDMEFNPRKLTKDEQEVIKNYKIFAEHIAMIDDLLLMNIDEINEKYVLVIEPKSFKFKQLYGKEIFHSLVKPKADRFLFLSSTILNKDAFCKDLGLDPAEAAFISVESEFPVDNRIVVYSPVMKMNYEWSNDQNYQNRKDMALKVKEICDFHSTESGIIHTTNFKVAEWIVSQLQGVINHDILHHNPESKKLRDSVIEEYLAKAALTPTILISPSITEGLDLKDDLGRFNIILKVGYGNLGDAWIKRRMDLSNEWYARQAMISVIQASGRTCRHKNDHAICYILDSSFNYLLYQTSKFVPDWWKNSIERM